MGPYKEEAARGAQHGLAADRRPDSQRRRQRKRCRRRSRRSRCPRWCAAANDVTNIGVSVDGRPVGRTETITDVGRMAVQQYDAIYPRIIAEAVVRRVVKKGVIYGGKEATGVQKDSLDGPGCSTLVGVAWEATEAADTRCWGLLPDKIQVLRLETAGRRARAAAAIGRQGTANPSGTADHAARHGRQRPQYLRAGEFSLLQRGRQRALPSSSERHPSRSGEPSRTSGLCGNFCFAPGAARLAAPTSRHLLGQRRLGACGRRQRGCPIDRLQIRVVQLVARPQQPARNQV